MAPRVEHLTGVTEIVGSNPAEKSDYLAVFTPIAKQLPVVTIIHL